MGRKEGKERKGGKVGGRKIIWDGCIADFLAELRGGREGSCLLDSAGCCCQKVLEGGRSLCQCGVVAGDDFVAGSSLSQHVVRVRGFDGPDNSSPTRIKNKCKKISVSISSLWSNWLIFTLLVCNFLVLLRFVMSRNPLSSSIKTIP